MDIKDNQQFNSEQEQPQRDEVDSVTQNQQDPSQDANENDASKKSEESSQQENPEQTNRQQQDDQQAQEGKTAKQEGSGQEEEEHSETSNESEIQENPDAQAVSQTEEDSEEQPHLSQADESTPSIDYTAFSREDLIERLKNLLESSHIHDIKKEVDIIKATFYKKQRTLNEEKKKEFINKGGEPEAFSPGKDPLEQELKDLLKDFKEKKAEVNSDIEEEKKKNLQKKYEVIDELKNLINKKESLGQTFREFRELQKRWKEIGPVPQNKLKDLWGTYHHHVERFYDYVKINKELRDLDLKKNLESKLDLCEKAENLDEMDDIVAAFNTLQEYHDQWREIGPVPNDKKEELWQRFKEATRVINKKHQEHFKELRKQQNDNLEAKQKLCEQAEEIAELEIDTHKDWNHYTRKILDLQKEWRKIGFAPKKHNNKIYRRFRKACDRFFAKKRVFYTQHKEWQENNLKKKQEFAERAEELKDSTDWDNTAKELIELQKKWKEIGPVPKKHSEEVWNRFRSACDEFFQRKKSQDSGQSKDYSHNLKAKQDLIEQIKNFQPGDDPQENLKKLTADDS